ncbi:MAG: carbohydrate ABC transporter permease [Halanaerobiales bacterium]
MSKNKNRNNDSLAKKEQKLAYKLLLPALIILFLVTIYPLGQVFVSSFTNMEFASDQETEFVGLDNYKELLGISVRELSPVIDEETGKQKVDEEGDPVYERPIEVLPREPHLHREITSFSVFGNKYVIGASDRNFIGAIANTIVFTVISVFIETILGLIIALVVNSKFKFRGAMRGIMLVPWAVITVVAARMWEWMFEPTRAGFFNMILDKLGAIESPLAFLSNAQLQLPAIIAIDVWKTTPFMALLILAGLQMIPKDLYEAAKVDGAGKIRQFFSITLPLLKPTITVALIFRTLDALRVFDVFQVVLSQRRYSMASYNYFQLISARKMGYSSAIGVIIFILIFIFVLFYVKSMGVEME